MIEVLQRDYLKIIDGAIDSSEQQHELATYCAQRLPDDGNIDWSKPSRDVYNFIRAQSDPYPGAFTYFRGQKMIIWRVRLVAKPYYGTPGQIARIVGDDVYVICGSDQAIILEEIEFKQERGSASSFIKSLKGRLSCSSSENPA